MSQICVHFHQEDRIGKEERDKDIKKFAGEGVREVEVGREGGERLGGGEVERRGGRGRGREIGKSKWTEISIERCQIFTNAMNSE